MGKLRNEQEVYARDVGLIQRVEYDVNNNAVYVGKAYPGKATSDSSWQIYKMTYDATNNMTALNWCQNSDDFRFSWDSRATYTYS